MTIFDIERVLATMEIIVDTREQETEAYHERVKKFECGFEKRKLDFGDYSCKYFDISGEEKTLENHVVIERKMSIDELCTCFTKERKRFKAEFERAKEKGAKTYLIIEGATWEKIYKGTYRSKLLPQALIASLLAWSIRYNIQFIFCKAESTGKMIQDILYRELKNKLESEG